MISNRPDVKKRKIYNTVTEPLDVITPTTNASFFLKAPIMPVIGATSRWTNLKEGLSVDANANANVNVKVDTSTNNSKSNSGVVSGAASGAKSAASGAKSAASGAKSAASGATSDAALSAASGAASDAADSLMNVGSDVNKAIDFISGKASKEDYDKVKNIFNSGKLNISKSGFIMNVDKNGKIDISNLDEVNFGIIDWIRYATDLSYVGVDINKTPIYQLVPDFADIELDKALDVNSKGLSEFNIGGQGCALGKKFNINAKLANMNNLTPEENAKIQKLKDPSTALASASAEGAVKGTPVSAPLEPDTSEDGESGGVKSGGVKSGSGGEQTNSGGQPKIETPKDTAESAQQGVRNIINNIKSNVLFRIVADNFKYIEFPFIYYQWFVKKIGILLCRIITKSQQIKTPPTEDEQKLVISKIGSVFSFLISILITYNWFFLMFYEYEGERPNRSFINAINYQMFKDARPIIHFLFEYIIAL